MLFKQLEPPRGHVFIVTTAERFINVIRINLTLDVHGLALTVAIMLTSHLKKRWLTNTLNGCPHAALEMMSK